MWCGWGVPDTRTSQKSNKILEVREQRRAQWKRHGRLGDSRHMSSRKQKVGCACACACARVCAHTHTRAHTHTHIGCGHLYILLLPFGKPYTCFLPWKILMFPLELKWNDQSHPFETFSVQYAGLLPCVFIAPCPSPCLSPYLPAVVLNWKLLKDMTL